MMSPVIEGEENLLTPSRSVFRDAFEYLVDSWQRSILFWDTMRRRGDIAMERQRQGHPPVLKYDYELIIDGRNLPRPVNYMLLRIMPKGPATADVRMRPFVIVDPRAGHGPGIGGFKQDSEIGMALRAGHPVYFVSFLPQPVPGQTLADVCSAEAVFIEEVARRHADADKPCVIANCQAGWAVAILASVRPEIVGPIILSGAPLAYWSGASGQNPMRYSGGLLGGKWMESLACDLGNGLFDGIYLVQNFENLNPANSLWGKYYNLYSQIDTESDRFLDFEAWWTGYFLLNAEEMDTIVSDLFIGNKLSRGLITAAGGKKVDLRSIRSPVVIFASRGDNISPPQQALNWIEDVYGSERVLIESGRVIIYLIHETIGHLGVFVSGGVARKEYSQLIGTLEMIDSVPPGLYEMKIGRGDSVAGWEELGKSEYSVRFEMRTMKDIHGLDDSREDEARFGSVEAVSKIGDAAYRSFVRPWIRLFTNDFTAELIRQLQPLRVQRTMLSSVNPLLNPVSWWASIACECRQPVSEDNVFRIQEQALSQVITAALDAYRDLRDTWCEFIFKTAYGPLGWGAIFPPAIPAMANSAPEEPFMIPEEAWTSGGQLAAILRMIAAVSLDIGVFDNRSLLIFNTLLSSSVFNDVTPTEVKANFRQQATLLRRDPARAIEGLGDMLLDEGAKRDAVNTILEVLKAVPEAAGMDGPYGLRVRRALKLTADDLRIKVGAPSEISG
jgi:pimeloyl-ACP methyl ester carboxylesterase